MIRELNHSDAIDAIWGGSVLACGGGGWVSHGELMAEMATRLGTPLLCSVDEIPDDALVATVTAIGAPGARDWEIQPRDYVNALKLLMDHADARGKRILRTAKRDSSSKDDEPALVGAINAREDLPEGALARAVLAAQRVAGSSHHLEADVLERERAGEPLGY